MRPLRPGAAPRRAPGGIAVRRRRDSPPPQGRVQRLAGFRSGQDLAGSRSRDRRGDRFLRLLRAPDAALRNLAAIRWCNCPASATELRYLPLGVGVVISAVEFPAGDPGRHDRRPRWSPATPSSSSRRAIRRPSPRSSCEVLLEAGFPPDSFTFLTGSGAAVGDVLVKHPKTRFIAFTGSRDVGLRINELAAQAPARARSGSSASIAEMGGKDAIIVDVGSRSRCGGGRRAWPSAFGYQGQKCSACSRAIVDAQSTTEFVETLIAEAHSEAHRRPARQIRPTTWGR